MTLLRWIDSFSDNLQSLMKEKNVSQNELSKRSGISIGSINAYLRKQSPPGVKAIVNIAYALDVSTDDLIDFGDVIE